MLILMVVVLCCVDFGGGAVCRGGRCQKLAEEEDEQT